MNKGENICFKIFVINFLFFTIWFRKYLFIFIPYEYKNIFYIKRVFITNGNSSFIKRIIHI